MRFIHLSSKQYPSTTADGLFVAEGAKAVARILGDDFLFVVARNQEPDRFQGIHVYETHIEGGVLRTVRNFLMFPKLRRYFGGNTLVYTNEQPLALVALLWRPFFKYSVIYEAHGFFNWRRDRIFLRLWRWWIDGIVTTSDSLKELLIHLEPKLASRVSVVRGGANPVVAQSYEERDAVRKELGIPASRCIVAYAGHFKTCGEKGIATLLDALTMAPSGSLVGLLIGGKPGEIADYQNRFPNAPVIYREWTTDALCVSRWLQSADVLVIPTSRDTLYTRYSFPMKAYDYLALGKPTVVSGLPIIREVMTEEVALTLRPGDAEGLMQALERLSSDAVLCERLGRNARDASRQYTWERRAEHILRVLQSKSL